MRFLHVVPDDKFIDAASAAFEEAAPGVHAYVHLGNPTQFRFLRRTDVRRISLRHALQPEFMASLAAFDAILIHYLDDRARLLMHGSPTQTRFAWIGWGGDYYHLLSAPGGLLLPETAALLGRLATGAAGKPTNLAASLPAELPEEDESPEALRIRVRRAKIGPRGANEADLLGRITMFAPVLRDEYDRVRSALPSFSAAYADWNYPLDDVGQSGDGAPLGTDGVLLGNSASPNNNHIDLLRRLAVYWSGRRRIYCPLSYGGSREYCDAVTAEGRQLFGDCFVPLPDFLDYPSYLGVLSSCSSVMMGHLRQQGFGNILLMMTRGARVFLDTRNPLLAYLRREGAVVHGLGEMAVLGDGSLDTASVRVNRDLVARRYGAAALRHRTEALLRGLARHPGI